MAEIWATEYQTRPEMGHIRLILANTAIGNDIPIEVAQAAVDWDCLLGYHPYWPVKNHVVPADERQWYSCAQAVAENWAAEYRTRPGMGHIRLILANTAIGNDIPIEVAQAAVDWDCLLGYHPYWPVKNDVVPADEWQWYSGRWTSMDADWRAQGVFVEWAFTRPEQCGIGAIGLTSG